MQFMNQVAFDQITCNRCGLCCERFHIETDSLREWVAEWQAWLIDHPEDSDQIDNAEGRTLVEMLIPLPVGEDGYVTHTCRHFTRDVSGLGVCGIYDRRPKMCSAFPYGQTQNFPGCSWDRAHIRVVKRPLPVIA